jgi:hypothetical protein
MAIATYSELKTAVASWLKRTDLAADIPNFISLGELRINRRLRIRGMEASAALTITAGAATIPSNLLSLKTITLNDANTTILERVSPINFFARNDAAGPPRVFTQAGNQYLFSPIPTGTTTAANCVYYASPTPLSDVAPTNWFMTNAPDVLLWAALAEAAPFMLEDPRIPVWEGKLEAALQALEGVECVEAMGGAVPTIRRV